MKIESRWKKWTWHFQHGFTILIANWRAEINQFRGYKLLTNKQRQISHHELRLGDNDNLIAYVAYYKMFRIGIQIISETET